MLDIRGPSSSVCDELKTELTSALQHTIWSVFSGISTQVSGRLVFSSDDSQYGDYDVDVDFGCEPLTLRAKKTGRKSTVPRKRQHCVSHKSAALDGQGYGNEREEQSLDSDSNTKNDNIDLELLPMGSNESESSLSGMVKKEGVGKVNEENAEENDDEEMDNEDADATFIPDHEDEDEEIRKRKTRTKKGSKLALTRHEAMYKCPQCPFKARRERYLKYHMRRHTGEKNHICSHCDMAFYGLDNLKKHISKTHDNNWHCSGCDRKFRLKTHLKEHLIKDHDHKSSPNSSLQTFACSACPARYVSRDMLQSHQKTKHEYVCSICGSIFNHPNQLKSHKIKEHKESALACDKCGHVSQTRQAFTKHMRRHVDKEKGVSFMCDDCGKTFTTHTSLHHHKRGVHRGEKPFKCVECGEAFSFHHSLKLHLLKHKGQRPHKCELCVKSYLTASHLKTHIQAVHQNMRKFTCPVCNKTFPYENSLRLHMMLHNGTRPFTCAKCGKGFVTKSSLKVHEASHVEGKSFQCDVCSKMYKTEMLLKVHKRRHTDESMRYMCDICGGTFMYKSTLEIHAAVHGDDRKYKCKLCDKAFKTYPTMYTHQQVHLTESKFLCSICNKPFKTKERMRAHQRRHSGAKPFCCDECGNCFPDKGGLSKHMKTVHAAVPRYACPICRKTCNRMDNLRVHMKVHNDPELMTRTPEQLLLTDEAARDAAMHNPPPRRQTGRPRLSKVADSTPQEINPAKEPLVAESHVPMPPNQFEPSREMQRSALQHPSMTTMTAPMTSSTFTQAAMANMVSLSLGLRPQAPQPLHYDASTHAEAYAAMGNANAVYIPPPRIEAPSYVLQQPDVSYQSHLQPTHTQQPTSQPQQPNHQQPLPQSHQPSHPHM